MTAQPMMEKQVRRYAAAFGWIDRVCVIRDAQGRLVVELYGDGTAEVQRQAILDNASREAKRRIELFDQQFKGFLNTHT